MSDCDCLASWEERSAKVEEEFRALAPGRLDVAMGYLDRWMRDPLCQAQWQPVLAHMDAGKYDLLLDSFYQFIPFGTGGRRGRVGFGPNRINDITVSLSVQGHCNFLRETAENPESCSVVVACDVRIFKDRWRTYSFLDENYLIDLTSRRLATIACEIYAGNGITCYLVEPEKDKGYLSTPELSFLIRRLGAAGGINVSASHNDPDDNGFKFFNEEGAQDIPPEVAPYNEELTRYMGDIDKVTKVPFEEGMRKGLVKGIPASLHSDYIDTNLAVLRGRTIQVPDSMPPIVFTPLCGTGTTTVADVLRAAGVQVVLHEPQSQFDGTFASVPFRLPNPEYEKAAWPAIETAEEHNALVVFSTDPDADRLGVLAKDANGKWAHLSGNEIGAVLAYYLTLDHKRGPGLRGPVVQTLVTTSMIRNIARKAECQTEADLLVGFKFIADVLGNLERTGRFNEIESDAEHLALAAEESHGFLLTSHVRDKDAAGAALVLCDLLAKLHEENMTLVDYLNEAAREGGNVGNDLRSIVMTGIVGTDALNRLMATLRKDPPSEIAGRPVERVVDHLCDADGNPTVPRESSLGKARNLLFFDLGASRVVIRPSGTEPKVKIYAEDQAPGSTRDVALQRARDLATGMYNICLKILGPDYELSPAAQLVPDYVEMATKRKFDTELAPELLGMAADLAAMSDTQLCEELIGHLGEYGADPLQAMRSALIALFSRSAEKTEQPKGGLLDGLASRLSAMGPGEH